MRFNSILVDEAFAAVVHLSGGDLAESEIPGSLVLWLGYFGSSAEENETIRKKVVLKWKAR